MEQWEFCRICTKCSKSGQYNKLFEDNKNKLIRQIEEITGILLTNSKKLPQYICKPCEDDLEKAHEFRERCIFAQEYFNTFEYKNELDKADCRSISPSHSNQHEVKDELPMEEIENADISDFKEESCDDLFKDGEVDTTVIESCNEETMNKFAYDEVEVISDAEFLIEIKEEVTTKPKLKSKRQIAEMKEPKKPSATVGKRLKAGRKKTNDKNQTFICDQCGNNFTCKHHFITHLRRHAGDKRYQCELCPDKFFTNSELNRHMRKHTGERPFACKHCGRRFTDYSTRIKHERTHTNERPFVCTQCTKAFTTSYILKNHMLVHTGERSFRCDLCNRSFQRQTHLVVHARSIMHKQNEEKQKQKACNIPATEHNNNANFQIIS